MRAFGSLFKRGHLFKAAAAVFCLTVLLGALAGCGKKGPPVAPRQAQAQECIQVGNFRA